MFLIVYNFESTQNIPLDMIGRRQQPHKEEHPIGACLYIAIIQSPRLIYRHFCCETHNLKKHFALGDN